MTCNVDGNCCGVYNLVDGCSPRGKEFSLGMPEGGFDVENTRQSREVQCFSAAVHGAVCLQHKMACGAWWEIGKGNWVRLLVSSMEQFGFHAVDK